MRKVTPVLPHKITKGSVLPNKYSKGGIECKAKIIKGAYNTFRFTILLPSYLIRSTDWCFILTMTDYVSERLAMKEGERIAKILNLKLSWVRE